MVLKQYERPADQGTAMQEKRAAYGQKYYDKYAGKHTAPAQTEPAAGVPFLVKVSIPDLNIRKGPGTEYARTDSVYGVGGIYHVDVSGNWGKAEVWRRLDFT